MFIAYSSDTKTTYYKVNTSKNACPTCGAQDLILQKETTTWKLFWVIPIFWLSTYTLYCPTCKKAKHVSSSEGKALVILSEHQNRNTSPQQGEQVFDEFSSKPQPSLSLPKTETTETVAEDKETTKTEQEGE